MGQAAVPGRRPRRSFRSEELPARRQIGAEELGAGQREVTAFEKWLKPELHLDISQLSLIPSSVGMISEQYGRELYRERIPLGLFRQFLLGVADLYKFFEAGPE